MIKEIFATLKSAIVRRPASSARVPAPANPVHRPSSPLSALRAEIRELAAQGRALNPAIQAASGRNRQSLRIQKAEIGDRARHLLLAYAFLRGIPYIALERTWRRAPVLSLVRMHVERHDPGAPNVTNRLGEWYLANIADHAPAAAE